jgi:hypothetical protein
MVWSKRPGGVYYYRSARVGGRPVKTYFGRGTAAELAASLDAEDRRKRQQQKDTLESEKARLRPMDEAMEALDAACNLAVEAELTAAGFHRQNYSAWRLKRVREPKYGGGVGADRRGSGAPGSCTGG